MTTAARSRFALACLAVLAATACASEPPRRGPGGPGGPGGRGGFGGGMRDGGRSVRPVALLFTSMDTNHDLVVEAAELTAALPVEWARADADGNGVASPFEMDAWCKAVFGDAEEQPGRISMDVNIDGSVTRAEFDKALQLEFSRMDANGDGRLERSEMLSGRASMGGEPGGGGFGGGEGGGQRRGGGPGGGGGGRRGGGGGSGPGFPG